MKRYKIVKVKRQMRLRPVETLLPGMLGPINVVHKIKLKPMKVLRKLLGAWMI